MATCEVEQEAEDDAIECVDARLKNRRAGFGLIDDVRVPEEADDDLAVEVEIELPHGEESFVEQFHINAGLGEQSVDELLEVVGLEPGVDSVREVVGEQVDVARRRDEWQIDIDTEDETEQGDSDTRVPPEGDVPYKTSSIGIVATLLGILGNIGGFAVLILGSISVLAGEAVPLWVLGVCSIAWVFGTTAYAAASKHGDIDSPMARKFRVLFRRDPSTARVLFHMLTGGHLILR